MGAYSGDELEPIVRYRSVAGHQIRGSCSPAFHLTNDASLLIINDVQATGIVVSRDRACCAVDPASFGVHRHGDVRRGPADEVLQGARAALISGGLTRASLLVGKACPLVLPCLERFRNSVIVHG